MISTTQYVRSLKMSRGHSNLVVETKYCHLPDAYVVEWCCASYVRAILKRRMNGWLRSSEIAFESLIDRLRSHGNPPLDLTSLSDEIETFIDDPRQIAPLPLKASMGNHENRRDMEADQYEDLGWRCFYLLALLPPDLRCPLDRAYQDSVREHFRLVYREAKTAKTHLVEGTLRYAIVVARLYLGRGIPFLDLVQEGTLGIASAAERYNEQRGTHFQQYAASWIRQQIERSISDRGRLIQIPVHQLDVVHKIDRYVEEFLDRQGKLPTDFQVFLQMGWMDAS